ncbi:transmembrane protein 107-like [Halichondria panicea]|uniref:transmembrane protein 107-like n=1 Tax=Halichondria panicea TaxID=6063 RepID=UPI00312B3EE6
MMMVLNAVIPARFLSLTAHLVINIMLFWSREPFVLACLPQGVGLADLEQYAEKDTQFLIALSLSLVFTVSELTGFLLGLSMFNSLPNMFSITAHVAASITLALFTVNLWSCDSYWYILGFCSVPPLLLEVAVVIVTIKFKVFL